MSQVKIYLENYSGVYYAGSEIRGRLECYFDDEVTVRGIKIRVKCKEYNSWHGTESYHDSSDNNRTKTRTITLTGDNTILFIEQMLYGSGNTLGRGRHVYPFSVNLPHDVPSTFKGPYGHISYKVKAIVDRPMRTDYEDFFIFIVQSPIDFNHMARGLQDVSVYSDEKSVCCWCCKGGNITMDVELPKTAFVPGETVPFKVTICNLSNSNVEDLKIKLLKTTTYKVTSPHHESKDDVEDILAFTEHGVGAHGEYTYNLQLQIPGHIEVPNFKKCNLFKVSYELKVSAEMPACTLDLDISAWDIKMGHVQCANYIPGDGGANSSPVTYPPPSYLSPTYPPAPSIVYPPSPSNYVSSPGGLPPYAGNALDNKPVTPIGPPSAPSSSIASAPMEDNPKAREAAGDGASVMPGAVPQLPPPPSYNQIQQYSVTPYPPQ